MIRRSWLLMLVAVAVGCADTTDPFSSGLVRPPPFGNTHLIAPGMIIDTDPTAYTGVTPMGQGSRTMFDRRVTNFVTVDAYLFDASFDDGLSIEMQVNPEFGDVATAQVEAEHYAEVIGRLPNALRAEVQTVWIHRGFGEPAGANNNLLIHTAEAALMEIDEVLEETLAHEAVHTSLDDTYAADPAFLAAVTADDWFVSTYARQFRSQEDLAESFIAWLFLRHPQNRLNATFAALINQSIPNRLLYFDGLGLDLHPFQ